MEVFAELLKQLAPTTALLVFVLGIAVVALWRKLDTRDKELAALNTYVREKDVENLNVLKTLTVALDQVEQTGKASWADVKAGIDRVLDRIDRHA
ncbi:MAG: hypothetical protein AAFP15_01870 [Bacteroidota bacterium]